MGLILGTMSSTILHEAPAQRTRPAAAARAPSRHTVAGRALALYAAAALVAGTLLGILAAPLVGEVWARLLVGGTLTLAAGVVAYCDETVRRELLSTW